MCYCKLTISIALDSSAVSTVLLKPVMCLSLAFSDAKLFILLNYHFTSSSEEPCQNFTTSTKYSCHVEIYYEKRPQDIHKDVALTYQIYMKKQTKSWL